MIQAIFFANELKNDIANCLMMIKTMTSCFFILPAPKAGMGKKRVILGTILPPKMAHFEFFWLDKIIKFFREKR